MSAAGFLARLPLSMAGIALLLTVAPAVPSPRGSRRTLDADRMRHWICQWHSTFCANGRLIVTSISRPADANYRIR